MSVVGASDWRVSGGYVEELTSPSGTSFGGKRHKSNRLRVNRQQPEWSAAHPFQMFLILC